MVLIPVANLWYNSEAAFIDGTPTAYQIGNSVNLDAFSICNSAPPITDYTFYQATYVNCINEACSGTPISIWVYNLVTNLINGKYYYNSDDNKAYQITSAPFTYAQYVTAGSPPAVQTNANFSNIAYDTCTCLGLAPD